MKNITNYYVEDKSKLISKNFNPLPEWTDALARYLKEIEV